MKIRELGTFSSMEDLVGFAHVCSVPVIVTDGDDECLVAMSPGAFERFIVEGEELNRSNRATLHL